MSYSINHILYASDLTPRSPAVFKHAVGLALKFEARLHAITVIPPSNNLPVSEFINQTTIDQIRTAGRDKAQNELQQRIDAFAKAHPELDVNRVLASVKVLEGDPSRQILDQAKHVLADMIIMGSRGHTAIGEILLGSVAHKVTMKADVPVLLVPIDR